MIYLLFSICVGVCRDGNVRIRGFNYNQIGRVEVCVNGSWSTVCAEHWDDADAKVACQQIGLSSYG